MTTNIDLSQLTIADYKLLAELEMKMQTRRLKALEVERQDALARIEKAKLILRRLR